MNEPILSVVCFEHKGPIERKIYKMALTPENLKMFWEKCKKFKRLFNKETVTTFQDFVALFVSQNGDKYEANGLFWVVDDFVGVLYLTDITTGLDGIAHFTFFDRRVYGRAPLLRALIKHAFDTYGLRRISAEAPEYLGPRVLEFIKEIGFKQEGVKRRGAYYNGQFHHKILYGILPEQLAATMPQSVVEVTEVKEQLEEMASDNGNGN